MLNNTYGATRGRSNLETALSKTYPIKARFGCDVPTSHDWAQEFKVRSLPGKNVNRTSAQEGSESGRSQLSLTGTEAQETRRKVMAFQTANQIAPETVSYAQAWLDDLRKIATENQTWWREPLVNVGIEQEVVFEWWYGAKKLTAYLLHNSAEYIKVWGADIDNEMQEGTAQSPDDLTSLWKWLAIQV